MRASSAPGDVLVRITTTNVRGSDLNMSEGKGWTKAVLEPAMTGE